MEDLLSATHFIYMISFYLHNDPRKCLISEATVKAQILPKLTREAGADRLRQSDLRAHTLRYSTHCLLKPQTAFDTHRSTSSCVSYTGCHWCLGPNGKAPPLSLLKSRLELSPMVM